MMDRKLEPELMQDLIQVQAYAEADFTKPHNQFIDLIAAQQQGYELMGPVLDLGCGSGDITLRFAQRFQDLEVDAVDGSAPMLAYARKHLPVSLQKRVQYLNAYLPDDQFSILKYQTLVSNSLLHHLVNAQVLWQSIKRYAAPGAAVYIMDLLRPESQAQAQQMVETYADDEPKILQTDFYNSLLAAFTLVEVRVQLQIAGMPLSVEQISDRHLFIYGKI